jgi:hypothetical protein
MRSALITERSIHLVYFYAEALARSGRLKEAAAQFRWAIERADMGTAIDPVILVRSYYRLWQVSEKLGDARTAEDARERVIHFWKDADEDVREMFDVAEGGAKAAS